MRRRKGGANLFEILQGPKEKERPTSASDPGEEHESRSDDRGIGRLWERLKDIPGRITSRHSPEGEPEELETTFPSRLVESPEEPAPKSLLETPPRISAVPSEGGSRKRSGGRKEDRARLADLPEVERSRTAPQRPLIEWLSFRVAMRRSTLILMVLAALLIVVLAYLRGWQRGRDSAVVTTGAGLQTLDPPWGMNPPPRTKEPIRNVQGTRENASAAQNSDSAQRWTVTVAIAPTYKGAQDLLEYLKTFDFDHQEPDVQPYGKKFRVTVGSFPTKEAAGPVLEKIKRLKQKYGTDFTQALIQHLELADPNP